MSPLSAWLLVLAPLRGSAKPEGCMPAFVLAGQSSMLGWGIEGIDALQNVSYQHLGRPLPGVWSFGITDVHHCGYMHQKFSGCKAGCHACDIGCESWAPFEPTRGQVGFCAQARMGALYAVGGPGPELGFAQVLHDGLPAIMREAAIGANLNRSFGIIKLAVGRTSMVDWEPANPNSSGAQSRSW